MFYFAEGRYRVLLYAAIFLSCLQGAAFPSFSILFGRLTNNVNATTNNDNLIGDTAKNSAIMLAIGVAVFFICFTAIILWNLTASAQVKRMKIAYYESLLSKPTSWFDKQRIDQLSAKFLENSNSI